MLSKVAQRYALRRFSSGSARVFGAAAAGQRRQYHQKSGGQRGSATAAPLFGFGVALGAGSLLAYQMAQREQKEPRVAFAATVDYQAVKKDIEALLDNEDYDDGSYGPVLVRLAWHASGTYNKEDGSGGSEKATMRFDPESAHGANAGLAIARDLLEPIHAKYPGLSYGDLWTLAGVVAIAYMNGPEIPWRAGRRDGGSGQDCTPDGRLPDASQGPQHLRDTFYRMGFNDQEIVALASAHALGRCHKDRSGYDGPWTKSPTMYSNDFFIELLKQPESRWTERKWKGPKQFEDKSKELMMLPADLALREDPAFRKWVEAYAADEELLFKDFANAFKKLTELGCKNLHDTDIFTPQKPWYQFW